MRIQASNHSFILPVLRYLVSANCDPGLDRSSGESSWSLRFCGGEQPPQHPFKNISQQIAATAPKELSPEPGHEKPSDGFEQGPGVTIFVVLAVSGGQIDWGPREEAGRPGKRLGWEEAEGGIQVQQKGPGPAWVRMEDGHLPKQPAACWLSGHCNLLWPR